MGGLSRLIRARARCSVCHARFLSCITLSLVLVIFVFSIMDAAYRTRVHGLGA